MTAQKNSSAFFKQSLGVRSRFLLGTALALILFCFLAVFFLYNREEAQLKEQAYAKTQLVMAAVEASRHYVREELRPAMYERFGKDFFLLPAMSTSYASRSIMDLFNQELPQYEYRRVAVNARNPDSEANMLEVGMIKRFRRNPELKNWQGVMTVTGDKQFMRFKPVYFQQSCMTCHGKPEDAPQELVERYGTQRGFGHQSGELAGVVAVGIPVQKAFSVIQNQATTTFLFLFIGASLFYAALAWIFNQVVVNNLRGVLHIFRGEVEDKRLQDFLPPIDPDKPRDEFQELTEAAVTMSEHLRHTKQELKNHAQNLEKTVARRTKALEHSQQLLEQKVMARNQELGALNRISELTTRAEGVHDVWQRVLAQTLDLIPAHGAGVYLLDQNQDVLVLRYAYNAGALPEEVACSCSVSEHSSRDTEQFKASITRALRAELCSTVTLAPEVSCSNIPISCRGRVLGVMSFIHKDPVDINEEQKELLLSIGRQIGIAVESLRDMHLLLHNKELLQTVFDGITDQLVLLDRDLRVQMVNQAYLRRYNVTLSDVLHRPCYEIHAGLDDICPDCSLPQVLEDKKPSSREVETSSGEIFLLHFYPIVNEDGEVENIIRYTHEITEQKKMDQKIQQTEKMVALGQVSSGIAHEINNPLGIILCYTDLLKRQLKESPQAVTDVDVIEQQARNCKKIVTDLLQFSKKQESPKSPEQINAIIQNVAQILRHQLHKNGIDFHLQLDPTLPLVVVSADKIQQVVVNLVLNAMQAVGEQGRIVVESFVQEEGRSVALAVWDNGPGVESSIRQKIFDPFYSTKRVGEGTGLGLSVSYGIIQDHGGEITLESEQGQWTRFIVSLPLEASLNVAQDTTRPSGE